MSRTLCRKALFIYLALVLAGILAAGQASNALSVSGSLVPSLNSIATTGARFALSPPDDPTVLVYFEEMGVLTNVSAFYSYQEGHIYDIASGDLVANVPNYQDGGTDIYDLSGNWIGEISVPGG